MGFFFRHIGEPGFTPCNEEKVSEAFLGLCEIRTGKPADERTVTNFLKRHPGIVRGSICGEYVFLKDEWEG